MDKNGVMDCMNFTVWNKKTVKFIQSVPNCFLRMETGIFYELEFYLRCFIGSFLRFKIWAFVKSEHASKQVTGKVRIAVLYARAVSLNLCVLH